MLLPFLAYFLIALLTLGPVEVRPGTEDSVPQEFERGVFLPPDCMQTAREVVTE